MNYRDAVTADRRLVILRLLENSSGYMANQFLLQSALEGFGHVDSLDTIATDLAWLEEQGLLTLEKPGNVQLAKISQRGLDVANGRSVVPGVKRPVPGE